MDQLNDLQGMDKYKEMMAPSNMPKTIVMFIENG
jgi:hypothetical protein